MNKLTKFVKTLNALGFHAVVENAIYRWKLKSGVFVKANPVGKYSDEEKCGPFIPLPSPSREMILPFLFDSAEQITSSIDRISGCCFTPFYGDNTAPLDFTPANPDRHWSEKKTVIPGDLKLIWEPSRFGWVDELMRGEMLHQDGTCETLFWRYLNDFTQKNPPNTGENWESAQEVALRMIKIVQAAGFFLNAHDGKLTDKKELKKSRSMLIAQIVSAHARRIPPTLGYAHSQRNNHLLSEAAGLMTAGVVLPESENASKWFDQGWKIFQTGLLDQISPDGCYIQQSTNYHRLMLQLVLWVNRLLQVREQSWPLALRDRIGSSVQWLFSYTDFTSGKACNLGHNDGSLLFAFQNDYGDFRPTLQAASQVFLNQPLYPKGPWDETGMWLGIPMQSNVKEQGKGMISAAPVLRVGNEHFWGILHTADFRGRPAHDDQLSVEIWSEGRPVAFDSGTYRYSGAKGWENTLKTAFVHNVLTIDSIETMCDAGKFLWLGWDKANILSASESESEASHTNFDIIGMSHKRKIEFSETIVVTDAITSKRNDSKNHLFRLHWLFPDQQFRILNNGIQLQNTRLRFEAPQEVSLRVIRSGKIVFKTDGNNWDESLEKRIQPISGWFSPTYDKKVPAISLIAIWRSPVPFTVKSIFSISKDTDQAN